MEKIHQPCIWHSLLCLITSTSVVTAAQNDWAEDTGTHDGASREYYNRAALLPWDNYLGDCGNITKATLRLYTYAQYGGASMDIGVFRCAQGPENLT